MSGRLSAIALFVVVGSIGAAVAASTTRAVPDATCNLPGPIACVDDSYCVAYDAVCDTQAGSCVCPLGDLGSGDLGGADLGGADLATRGDGGGSSATGGSTVGGGMTGPARNGCSFVPGER